MIHRICHILESWKATLVSGFFVSLSLYGHLSQQPTLEILAWVSIIVSGLPLAWEAFSALIEEKKITSALLITMAMIAAIGIGEYFAAAEVAFLMALGELLEHATLARAQRGLERLLRLTPTTARRLNLGREETIPAEQVHTGDLLRVKPGEIIPADGIIRTGTTSINQAILTGESLPVDGEPGSAVFAGTLNGAGSIDIEATHPTKDTSLQRLIHLVQECDQHQAPIQREADRWASWIVPTALTIALAGFVIMRFLGYDFTTALIRGVTVLVVFCPCALALATPTSIMAAIGQAARRGVIIKSGAALEKLGRADIIAFDKTGTLTQGKPTVSDVIPLGSICSNELLTLVAAVESRSEHPLAQAIVNAADTPLPESTHFRAQPGRGVAAVIAGETIYCGNETFLDESGIHLTQEQRTTLEHLRQQGMAIILAGRGSHLIGLISLCDQARPGAPEALAGLSPLKTILLTGDHPGAAQHIAKAMNIPTTHAGLLPEQKLNHISRLQQEGHIIAMVGDGINDAPALKQADIGISMSQLGSDIATEAADISLLQDDLRRLPYLKRLAHSTLNTIRLNIAASMLINLVAVILSLLGVLNPVTGALVHNAGSVLVILNAALLYDRKFD